MNVENEIKFAARLGELKPDPNVDPRPIKLAFQSVQQWESIFNKARKLLRTNFANVNIVSDLTELQRGKDKELAEEVERITEELSADEGKNWETPGKEGRTSDSESKEAEQQSRHYASWELRRKGDGRGKGGANRDRIQRQTFQVQIENNDDVIMTEGEEDEEHSDNRKRDRNSTNSSPGFSGMTKRQKRADKQRQDSQ